MSRIKPSPDFPYWACLPPCSHVQKSSGAAPLLLRLGTKPLETRCHGWSPQGSKGKQAGLRLTINSAAPRKCLLLWAALSCVAGDSRSLCQVPSWSLETGEAGESKTKWLILSAIRRADPKRQRQSFINKEKRPTWGRIHPNSSSLTPMMYGRLLKFLSAKSSLGLLGKNRPSTTAEEKITCWRENRNQFNIF